GVAGQAAAGLGEVEPVHKRRAAACGVGIDDAHGGDPVFLGGNGADAALFLGKGWVDGFIARIDGLETGERDVAEVGGGGVFTRVWSDEAGGLVEVGAQQET